MSETYYDPLSEPAATERRRFTRTEVRTILLDGLRPLAMYLDAFRDLSNVEGRAAPSRPWVSRAA